MYFLLHSMSRNKRDVMKLVSKAADSFCDGDLVDRTIRSRNAWGLLPTQVQSNNFQHA